MKIKINNVNLNNLNQRDYIIGKLKTTGPPYDMISRLEKMGLGYYTGGFHDSWSWNDKSAFDKHSELILVRLYNELANYWNKDYEKIEYEVL